METLKFLMVSSHYPPNHLGGDAVMVQYLSEELVRRGHEVHVFHDPAIYALVRGTRVQDPATRDGGPIVHAPRTASSRGEVLFRLSFDRSARMRDEVRRLTRELDVDVVHWHNTKGLIGRPFVPQGAVTLCTAHDYYLVCARSNLARPGMSFCMKPFMCQTCLMRWRKPPQLWRAGPWRVIRPPPEARVLCPSEFMARRLQQDGVLHCHVLRNFVPDMGPKASAGSGSVVYVGLIEAHKGPHTLLEAFARSKDQQGFRLSIVGEGSLKEGLMARAAELKLTNRVDIPGFVPRTRLEELVRGATAMIVPSEWPENAPLTVLEAFSMGTPVLGTDQGGLPEILCPESGSEVFKAGAVDELAEAIVALWRRRDDMAESCRRARQAYESRFSPAAHIGQYMRIINEDVR